MPRIGSIHLAMMIIMLLSTACADEPEQQMPGELEDMSMDADDSRADSSEDQDHSMPDAGMADLDAGVEGRAPLIQDANLCEEPTPNLAVSPGTDLLKVTLDDPDAVCNDGSPAVIYIRPAPAGSADADRWVAWLEPGGGCNSATACRQRWCGSNIGKMTSRFAPDGIRATGMFVDRPDNDFAGWNHVVAYYCSSDSWSGRKRTLAIDDEGLTPSYEIYVHGAYIVDAIFDALEDGATSDDGTMTMPTIDGAAMVLLAGTSAGAGGVRSNADRIGERLRGGNPSVDYRIIVDAGFYPVDPHPPELAEADALEALDFKHEIIVSWRDGATDASCLAYHAGDERWCSDNSHLMAHHITTPAFVKQDLRDGAPGLYANARTYSNILLEWFLQVEEGTFVPEEPDVPLARTGLFAPNCDHHLNLNVSSFYDISLTNGVDELSMHDLTSNWIQGVQPYRAIHAPEGELRSVCPE